MTTWARLGRRRPQQDVRGPFRYPGAFTLIELLVVIAILALLMAILLPGLQRARLRARVVRAHADLRQIALALDSYAMEFRDQYPPTRLACGNDVNYQLPVELAQSKYFPRLDNSAIPQAGFMDVFAPLQTYKYRAPGGLILNGQFSHDVRSWIWVPLDFPQCFENECQRFDNGEDEPPCPALYAVWSIGPDPESGKFPRDAQTGAVDETRFPLPRRYWLTAGEPTGLITCYRSRQGHTYHSP
ncbi:MAG: prepilin-type N-terminal cleavage/methylation domain-containing protein [Planctomycetes bacterium]|nr:prepilin-type N-terminal cleavage/methylation domain-containing protein [Planctomycetota bacterium]